MSASRVCIITTVHPSFDTRIFQKEAKTLVQAGYDVTLIAQHERDEVVDGVRIIALPKPRNRFTRIFGLTWRAFRLALRQRADIYHFHDPELLPIGVLLKLLTRGRVIYDVHENLPRQIVSKHWIPRWLRPAVAALASVLERSAALAFDGIVTATDSIARRFPRRKTVVVRNFPRTDECPVPSRARTTTSMRLAYTGGLTRGQGIREMIAAMERLPQDLNLTLCLAGEFDPPNLVEEVRRMEGWKRVEFLGLLSRESVFKILQSSFAGLVVDHPLPNYVDGLSTKMFEYMLAGLPIIVSNFPYWRKIVEEARCGILVDPFNPDDIARAVLWLIQNPQEAQAMGLRGRKAVETFYNWNNEVSGFLSLYDRLTR